MLDRWLRRSRPAAHPGDSASGGAPIVWAAFAPLQAATQGQRALYSGFPLVPRRSLPGTIGRGRSLPQVDSFKDQMQHFGQALRLHFGIAKIHPQTLGQ